MTVQILSFEGSPVREVLIDGEPWFAGKDACAILGIADHKQALGSLPDDERGGYSVPTPGGVQELTFVNEPGLYRLIFKSRKPEAERFKRWVLHEVLPEIRRTGAFGEKRPEGASAAAYEVPVAEYIALLQWKVAAVEEKAVRKPKKAAPRPVSEEEIADFRARKLAGQSIAQISRETGRSEGTISQLLRGFSMQEGRA